MEKSFKENMLYLIIFITKIHEFLPLQSKLKFLRNLKKILFSKLSFLKLFSVKRIFLTLKNFVDYRF